MGQHVRQLAAGLVADGHDVTVACPSEVAHRFELADTGARVVEVALGSQARGGLTRPVRRRLRRAVDEADVVHAHGVRAGAAVVLSRRGAGPPVVVTSHNGPPAGRAGAVYAILERLVCRRADLVLGVSPDLVRRAMARGARAAALAVVPANVTPLDPAARARARRDLRDELGLDPGRLVLLTAGRLAPQKRIGAAISAYHHLLRDRAGPATPESDGPTTRPAVTGSTDSVQARPDLPVLVVVGEGPEEADLRQLATTAPGEVRWLGRRDDVPHLLAAADVVISSSVWEGQPLVLQEALAAGAPIVATDVGGTSLVLGGAGVLVDGTDEAVVPALAAALADLLADPDRREELSALALERAQQLSSVADAVAAAHSAYVQVLASGRSRER